MEQFLAVAVAHFLALLIPGVDFFLIARTATASGRRNAGGICVGIACANGILIAAAFSGLSLISTPAVLRVIQAAGGAFLVWIGIAFFRAEVSVELTDQPRAGRIGWAKSLGLGLASGLLNPKNVLFYVSLAAALSDAGPVSLMLYGAWMVTIVLAWDLLVAVALGSRHALAKLSRVLPWLTKAAGGFLAVLGLGMILTLVTEPIR
ncbi:LysE family translocator [Kitasatospora sp. NPDC097691]|uniref:LysE family translocator n=1 Tax=Kitasatospora sp. NPDC097691 TaxID=3157231 RepID=UPI00332626F4